MIGHGDNVEKVKFVIIETNCTCHAMSHEDVDTVSICTLRVAWNDSCDLFNQAINIGVTGMNQSTLSSLSAFNNLKALFNLNIY